MKKYLSDTLLMIRKRKVLFIIGLILTLVGAGMVKYVGHQNTASIQISGNYALASQGENPNGTRFDVSNFTSDDVMQKILTLGGLDGKVTSDQLKECYSVEPVESANQYIETTYRISYRDKAGISDITPQGMLLLFYESYRSIFIANTKDNTKILEYSPINVSGDFRDIAARLQVRVDEISGYLKDRVKENNTFEGSNGKTFAELKAAADEISSVDISNLTAYINENGIVKNNVDVKSILEYENYMLGMTYQKYMNGYNVRKQAISDYDSGMSAVVLVPSVNTDKEYYMSRTKTGIDYLASDANSCLSSAQQVNKTIETNSSILSLLGTENASESASEKTDGMVEAIDEKIATLLGECSRTNEEYINYKTKDYLSMTASSDSFGNVLRYIAKAIAVYIIAVFMAAYVFAGKESKCADSASLNM